MSLILEALKKSEANRRLGAAPDLATPFSPARSQRSSLPWLIVAVIVAAIAGWWLLRPAAPKAAKQAQAPAIDALKPAPKPQVRHFDTQPAAPRTSHPAVMPPQTRPVQPMSQSPVAAMPRGGAAMDANQARRAEMLALRNNGQPLRMAAAPAHGAAATTTPPPANPVARAPKTATTRGYTAPAPATNAAPTASAPGSEPAVTPYYSLAFAVRKALPQLKLSMHVYSADPEQRFVILNDARMVEGDTTPDGIQLHAIEPDGVILDFKGQRFFFPRDGM